MYVGEVVIRMLCNSPSEWVTDECPEGCGIPPPDPPQTPTNLLNQSAFCGDGIVDPDEWCDDGNTVDGVLPLVHVVLVHAHLLGVCFDPCLVVIASCTYLLTYFLRIYQFDLCFYFFVAV